MTPVDRFRVDDIPVLVARPEVAADQRRLVLWLHFLGGSGESMRAGLDRLVGHGCTGVAFDAWQHGGRTNEDPAGTVERVLGSFRAEMWPILGHTVLDAVRVIDWALGAYELNLDVRVGGISMGGDIAVALAGVDPRVVRAGAVAGSPDWTRPGTTVVDQSAATAYGEWLAARLDPIRNLGAWDRPLRLRFDCGGDDDAVPAAGAEGFRLALRAQVTGPDVEVVVHPRLTHRGVCSDEAVVNGAIDWLTTDR